MTQKTKSILRAALALPQEQRAHLAAELLDSLEPSTAEDAESVARLWGAEIERRARRAIENQGDRESWESVRERTARILKNQ